MKNNDLNFNLIIITLFFILMFCLSKSKALTKEFFKELKMEIYPVLYDFEDFEKDIKNSLIPIAYLEDEEYYDLSFDDFRGYENVNVINMASQSDAYVDNNINNEQNFVKDSDKLRSHATDINDAKEGNKYPSLAVANFNDNSINYTMEQLNDFDFLVTNCYAVDSTTNVTKDELDVENLLSKDMSIDTASNDYKVLIYHTHGSEEFIDSREGETDDTVIGVGRELKRILEEDYNIKTYHDETIYDVVDGVLDRSYAYDLASEGVDEILEKYPSIEVVLDVHRDGVRDDVHLVREIDGRPTAQIMFLNGVSRTNANGEIDYLYNPYKVDNLAFSLQMHLVGKSMYGDLLRRIYIRGYCFNLDKMPRASLIEVGAQTNTVEEAKNAMIPLGAILYKVLSEK